MTLPLCGLALPTIVLSFFATPAWPWFHHYLIGGETHFDPAALAQPDFLMIAIGSTALVAAGAAAAWMLYAPARAPRPAIEDPLAVLQPKLFHFARNRFFVDEFYDASVIRFQRWLSQRATATDNLFSTALARMVARLALAFGWLSRLLDELAINELFDRGCQACRTAASGLVRAHNGQIQDYLRVLALALGALMTFLLLHQ